MEILLKYGQIVTLIIKKHLFSIKLHYKQKNIIKIYVQIKDQVKNQKFNKNQDKNKKEIKKINIKKILNLK